ncbi:hypothetical protein E5676_scaffold347G001310 [Cucumis melo var. makuwa]|uniref:Uncharacterized protein n=2 Tax=Cucumis melo TaxID=3656 RepID=A0A5A7UTZ4_CUCMM|nr:hypothetical protein E6C27_scaffold242G001190 [Cucumis melo var. makuwa]TYK03934.1 hypothetical protein E5676_scaffold347G001310 [Cucumis melo var. makuwa]
MRESYKLEAQDEAKSLLRSGYRRPSRRWILLRRKKLPTARLGGRRPPRTVAIWRSIKEIKMRKWAAMMTMKVRCKDIAGFNAFLKKILLEISLAIPLLGVSLSI